ncbi:MAG: lipoprotein-releasing ABC transporter permease subunit [Pseudomonadota bacterium]
MFKAFERKIAFRYLRTRRRESFISIIAGFSILGITLGVATLIIVMSVMNGFRDELTKQILGFNGHLGIHSARHTNWIDFQPLTAQLKNIGTIKAVTPMIERQAMVMKHGIALGAMVHGIESKDLKNRKTIAANIRFGDLNAFTAPDTVVIGQRMAEKLRVFPGDSITLVSPKGTATAFGTAPRMRSFRIGAIFAVGMHAYDLTNIFIPLETAQKFFQTGPGISGVEIFVQNPDDIESVRRDIEAIAAPNLRIVDWRHANAPFFQALQVERNVMFIILTLIILIAAFNIISTLIMLVKDKGHDIAIMRTMGATRQMVMRIFLLTGTSIGIVGTVFGTMLGLAFALNIETIRQALQSLTGTELFSAEIYFLSQLPAKVNFPEVIVVTSMSLGLSFLATLYPSWRAARLDPVEALRYE